MGVICGGGIEPLRELSRVCLNKESHESERHQITSKSKLFLMFNDVFHTFQNIQESERPDRENK